MKKFIPGIFAVFMGCMVVSCSKDDASARNGALSSDPVSANPPSTASPVQPESRIRAPKGGSVTLKIMPLDSYPQFIITNEGYTSENFYTTRDAYARIDDVPIGVYTLIVKPTTPGYATMEIRNVKVTAEFVRDLGIIKLQ
jgi:hypothetical protein